MRHAIIDIGSNAVRAVIYNDLSLGASEIYNDKFRSDILSLLELEDLDIQHHGYLTLQYFMNIFQQLEVKKIDCVATAVVRNHPRADEFVKIIKEKFGLVVEVISGEKEAYLTATGLISGIADASGIAVDLGGGSLEVIEVKDNEVGNLSSLPIGSKTHEEDITDQRIEDLISEAVDSSIESKHLYLIGGGFRFLGRNYMEFIRYPLKNLHYLEIGREDFLAYLEKLDESSQVKGDKAARGIDQMAVRVVRSLIKVIQPESLVISNYGLKEGVRFLALSDHEQEKDIIFEKCKGFAQLDISKIDFDKYLDLATSLLIDYDDITANTAKLAIILSHCGQSIDRTLKAHYISEFILSSDIPFSHRQRIMLAHAISYGFKMNNARPEKNIQNIARKILNKNDYYNSRIIGDVLRIMRAVDGPEFKFPSFDLQIRDRYIEIITEQILPRPIFETICRHLKDINYARKYIIYHR